MSITQTAKPSSSNLTNSAKVVSYETFDTNTTTFDTETRTFDEMGTTMTNTVRPTTSITNTNKP